MAAKLQMKQLLESGVHFGHQSKRWNPKMDKYIFTKRKNIHIIDLQQTMAMYLRAYDFVVDLCSKGGNVLFLGTKKQAQDIIKEEAERCGMPYINQRWLGGTLTNFSTVKNSIDRLFKIEEMIESGLIEKLPNKEKARLYKEYEKKQKILGGIKHMDGIPDALFVIDMKRDEIGVFEANKLHIPVIAVLDTNADPDYIDYGIPGNDDAIRAIQLFCNGIADAVIEGKTIYEKELEEKAAAEAAEQAEKEEAQKVKSEAIESNEKVQEENNEVSEDSDDNIRQVVSEE
jgi:small subunit ribosomal protein S2